MVPYFLFAGALVQLSNGLCGAQQTRPDLSLAARLKREPSPSPKGVQNGSTSLPASS
eukprot:CAMPEP_0181240928 /NCGR_PEP_ID=MMETSP1096-20121128/40821_1 /TAXON_ID=156174 ORGANISM="Chrysochromulina ericina, Strain CCMP281" /NCGR_SAMPLE_ID=MMETSP1096 /ASSEMBLY_ACC=CAM_ASM_000453 /LENGTH=56 /DNA_ID=CAMNT_0023336909 /DNA_START=183 /DNA_END=349 /DNA_ORIENTATION=-